jgi:pyruvate decarboxylase/indolepyruvate decarboxylase
MPSAKSFFPETHSQYVGTYFGGVSSPGCEAIIGWADLILAAGPVFNDYTTVGWTAVPSKERLISVEPRYVRTADAEFTNVGMGEFLAALAKNVKRNDATVQEHSRITSAPQAPRATSVGDTGRLTREGLWRQIQDEIDGKSTLLVETGDSWLNGLDIRLPEGARFEIEMQWGSIGWATPAAFGYAMGLEPGRRLIAVSGDGSFQLTAQEVANMIRYGQETLFILYNNHGYVVESEIHDGPYNYIKNWDYAGLIGAFNAEDGRGLALRATTPGELKVALKKARGHKGGPAFIEVLIAHDDCNPNLIKWGSDVARANARPPQYA